MKAWPSGYFPVTWEREIQSMVCRRAGLQPHRFERYRGDARSTLAAPPPRPRGLAPVRTGSRHNTAHQVILRRAAGHRVAERPGATDASTVAHRAAVPRAQRRIGARSLRRAVVCRVASPRRPDRPGVRVAATRTSTRRRASADPASRPSGDHGDLDGAFLRHATALLEDHAETRGNRSANLTK